MTARTLRPGRTGVGYYTEHLLHHLVAGRRADDELIVVSNRPVDTTRPLPAHVRVVTSPAGACRGWCGCRRSRRGLLRQLQPDVVHFTNGMMPLASPVPTVVTIHDMSLTLYPRYHPPRRVLLNRPLVDLAARRADAIITVSQSAKRDIVRLYGLPPERVHVVHEAAAPSFRPSPRSRRSSSASVARYGLADRFILYVGTIEPRKNLPKLIEAFARRRQTRRSAASARLRRPVRLAVAATSKQRIERLGGRATRSASPATCRSTICRRSTTWRRCSCSRRSTKASACR